MKYIISIDAGTTGVTILLINHKLEIIDKEYSEFTQIQFDPAPPPEPLPKTPYY